MLDNTFWDGVLFGIGTTIALVGFVHGVMGPIPEDWTLIPTGLIVAAVAVWSRLRAQGTPLGQRKSQD